MSIPTTTNPSNSSYHCIYHKDKQGLSLNTFYSSVRGLFPKREKECFDAIMVGRGGGKKEEKYFFEGGRETGVARDC